MISYLEGKIISCNDKFSVILVGGVGYKIFLHTDTAHTIQQIQGNVKIYIHMHVREDALNLYGFLDFTELELFELLLSISGIGPKAALVIISADKPSVLAGAIAREDVEFLSKISGIGSKTAQKIVMELKEKVVTLSFDIEDVNSALDGDAIDALVALGWSVKEARNALRAVPKNITEIQLRVKEALKTLG